MGKPCAHPEQGSLLSHGCSCTVSHQGQGSGGPPLAEVLLEHFQHQCTTSPNPSLLPQPALRGRTQAGCP